MKIALLMGNPRKNGYTQRLAEPFIAGIRGSGAELDIVDLPAQRINHCVGCYSCWLVHPGVCIHRDDMVSVMEKFCRAEIVVIASPLNAYGVSTPVKAFLDRTLAWTQEGFVSTPAGLTRNTVRDPARWPKKLAYLLVGAFRGRENFAGAEKSLELFAQGIDTVLCGGIVRPESYLLQFDLAKPKTIKTIEAAFEQAGLELGSRGAISSETAARAATPLSSDLDHFQKYANIYWEHARTLGPRALDVTAVEELVITDMRVLLSEMARSIDPSATARLKAVIAFDFHDTDMHFTLRVDKGTCVLSQGDAAAAGDLRIATSAVAWAGVFMRRINVRDALVSGEIKLEGDKSIFTKLDRYFPPPVA